MIYNLDYTTYYLDYTVYDLCASFGLKKFLSVSFRTTRKSVSKPIPADENLKKSNPSQFENSNQI